MSKLSQYIQELKAERERYLNFKYSTRLATLLRKVCDKANKIGSFNDQDILYFPKKFNFTLESYQDLFRILAQDMVEESPSLFPTNYVILARGKNKYKFSIVIGQGSAYITDKV